MKIVHQQSILFKAAILLLVVAAISLLGYYGPQSFSVFGSLAEKLPKFYTSKEKFSEFLTSLGAYSPLLFISVQVVQVLIAFIPGELTGFVGGYIYGATLGFIYSTIGLTLGSWGAFALARFFGRPLVENFVSEELLEKFEFLTTYTGATICFALFLIPGFPKDGLCYLLGVSRMGLSTFLVMSTLGRMPGTFLLTLQGASMRYGQYRTSIAVGAVSLAVVVIAYVFRLQLERWVRNLAAKDLPKSSA
jgi:uncharacterized membrane protein YdjX (TVP38/TMEM64 family)